MCQEFGGDKPKVINQMNVAILSDLHILIADHLRVSHNMIGNSQIPSTVVASSRKVMTWEEWVSQAKTVISLSRRKEVIKKG
jgi:hypothetical protein